MISFGAFDDAFFDFMSAREWFDPTAVVAPPPKGLSRAGSFLLTNENVSILTSLE